MNRGTGTGLIVFGVILGVVGGVMAFAVTVQTHGFNINTAGWILLVVGIVVFVIGIAILVTGSRRSSTTVENVQSTPSGQERVEERRDWGSPWTGHPALELVGTRGLGSRARLEA